MDEVAPFLVNTRVFYKFVKNQFMQAYRFETRISKNGLIQLPLSNQLFDREVEIIILPKQKQKRVRFSSTDFVDKWSGFLANRDADDSKFQYLSDKYK